MNKEMKLGLFFSFKSPVNFSAVRHKKMLIVHLLVHALGSIPHPSFVAIFIIVLLRRDLLRRLNKGGPHCKTKQ